MADGGLFLCSACEVEHQLDCVIVVDIGGDDVAVGDERALGMVVAVYDAAVGIDVLHDITSLLLVCGAAAPADWDALRRGEVVKGGPLWAVANGDGSALARTPLTTSSLSGIISAAGGEGRA